MVDTMTLGNMCTISIQGGVIYLYVPRNHLNDPTKEVLLLDRKRYSGTPPLSSCSPHIISYFNIMLGKCLLSTATSTVSLCSSNNNSKRIEEASDSWKHQWQIHMSW